MKKLVLFLFVATLSVGMVSCGDDDGAKSCTQLESELTILALEFLELSFDYDADPSAENCSALKANMQELIDISESGRKCVDEADLADFDDDLQELQDALNQLPC